MEPIVTRHRQRNAFSWLAALALLGFPLRADPQDGPHADIRIRIDDDGVRVHLILNLAFIDEIVDVPRESPDALYEVERDLLREALQEHLAESLQIRIDEQAVEPRFVGFEAPEPELDLLPLFPRAGMRALLRLAFTIDFPAPVPPRIVLLHWGDYPPNPLLEKDGVVPPLEVAALLSAYGEDRLVRFRPEEPEYVWRSTGRSLEGLFRDVPPPPRPAEWDLPAASLGIALGWLAALGLAARRGRARGVLVLLPLAAVGSALASRIGHWTVRNPFSPPLSIGTDDACEVLKPLLFNVYRAFDYEEEERVYDALARSVTGDLLDQLYDRIYSSLVYQEAGGAVARIRNLELVDCSLEGETEWNGRPALVLEALWQVAGGVYHWGHTHARRNEYRARFTLAPEEGEWRIAAEEVLSAHRLDATPNAGFEETPWIDPDQEF